MKQNSLKISNNVYDLSVRSVKPLSPYIEAILEGKYRVVSINGVCVLTYNNKGVWEYIGGGLIQNPDDENKYVTEKEIKALLNKAAQQVVIGIPPADIIECGLFDDEVNSYLISRWYEDNNDGEYLE